MEHSKKEKCYKRYFDIQFLLNSDKRSLSVLVYEPHIWRTLLVLSPYLTILGNGGVLTMYMACYYQYKRSGFKADLTRRCGSVNLGADVRGVCEAFFNMY